MRPIGLLQTRQTAGGGDFVMFQTERRRSHGKPQTLTAAKTCLNCHNEFFVVFWDIFWLKKEQMIFFF